jgi:hypothetical protein
MKDFNKMLKHTLRVAERGSVRPPVIVLLKHDSSRATSIFKQMSGNSIISPEVQLDPEYGSTSACNVSIACDLLRRYCGIGGLATANFLEGKQTVDYWLLMIDIEWLSVLGCRAHQKSIESSAYFDNLFGGLCGRCLKKRGPVFLEASLKGGDSVTVQGKNALEAAYVLSLVTIASTRRLLPFEFKDRNRGMPVKDVDVAEILRQHFVSRPRSVSEALSILRHADRTAYRWLTKIVKSVPALNAESSTNRKRPS